MRSLAKSKRPSRHQSNKCRTPWPSQSSRQLHPSTLPSSWNGTALSTPQSSSYHAMWRRLRMTYSVRLTNGCKRPMYPGTSCDWSATPRRR
eukprot:6345935-Pyramimonas_sp.AAC.1